MTENENHDKVFKPLPSLWNFPFFGLRFIRLRYIVSVVFVWNALFLLIRGMGGSVPLDQSPERLLAQGLFCLAFAACCFAVLFVPSVEMAVLAKPEGRRLLRRDLWMVAVTLIVLGVITFWNAVRILSDQ
jgi:uncharacterized BrkB/YihY/UPF0761 family membrane protein